MKIEDFSHKSSILFYNVLEGNIGRLPVKQKAIGILDLRYWISGEDKTKAYNLQRLRLYEVFAERSGAKIWVERSGTI